MTASITHSTVVAVADDGTSPVGTTEWNAAHSITGTIDPANGGTGAGAFTAGSIVFAGASGVYAQDNTNLFFDDTTNILKLNNSTILFGPAPNASFAGSVGILIGDGTAANSGATPGFIVNAPGASNQGAFCGFQIAGVDVAYFGTKGGVTGGSVTQGFADLAFAANNVANGGGIRFSALGNTSAKGTYIFSSFASGSSATILDYGVSNASKWTITNAELVLTSNDTSSTTFNLSNTSTGGLSFLFFSTGQLNNPGNFGVFNGNSGYTMFACDSTANFRLAGAGVFGWTATANSGNAAADTGIARNAAGVLEINNGTRGTLRDLTLRSLLPIAGTISVAPLTLISGTLLTTAAAGAFEFDGKVLYGTAVASSRQAIVTEQVLLLNQSRTFTNNTTAQPIFAVTATPNGAVTLAASTTYEFEMQIAGTGFSASAHTFNLSFLGTATFTTIAYYFDAQSASTLATPTASLTGYVAVATAVPITASATTTGLLLYVRGTMRISGGGTVIPTLTQVTASLAGVIQRDGFFRCWPVGNNTVTGVGNLS